VFYNLPTVQLKCAVMINVAWLRSECKSYKHNVFIVVVCVCVCMYVCMYVCNTRICVGKYLWIL